MQVRDEPVRELTLSSKLYFVGGALSLVQVLCLYKSIQLASIQTFPNMAEALATHAENVQWSRIPFAISVGALIFYALGIVSSCVNHNKPRNPTR